MRSKVLIICMLDSVHTARWLTQFKDQERDFYIFPSSPHRAVHPDLKNLIANQSAASYQIWFPIWGVSIFLWMVDKVFRDRLRGFLVRRYINTLKPQVLHSLELQNAGYVAAAALRKGKPDFIRFLATNWGSDIFWFQQFKSHRGRIAEVLRLADAYSCECERDVTLARGLGFTGEVMPVIPNAGGVDDDLLKARVPPLEDRKIIAVKGYHGWVGRAKIGLDAIGEISKELIGYRVVVFSANLTTVRRARKLSRESNLEILVHKKGKLSHSEVLAIFAETKVYLGLSLSDGISTSLIESMAMGAIPVQTSSACCSEWFSKSGVMIKDIRVTSVIEAIRAGLILAKDQENSEHNRDIIREKASAASIREIAITFYE